MTPVFDELLTKNGKPYFLPKLFPNDHHLWSPLKPIHLENPLLTHNF